MNNFSRDTSTGLRFEEKVKINKKGIDVSKHNLYQYLKSKNINYLDHISRKLLPDEAYIDEESSSLYIYEKKCQYSYGSVDEKPQTCAFKIMQFRKLAQPLHIKNVYYTYIFNDWFKRPEYKDMLEYIKSVDGCDYFFWEDLKNAS